MGFSLGPIVVNRLYWAAMAITSSPQGYNRHLSIAFETSRAGFSRAKAAKTGERTRGKPVTDGLRGDCKNLSHSVQMQV